MSPNRSHLRHVAVAAGGLLAAATLAACGSSGSSSSSGAAPDSSDPGVVQATANIKKAQAAITSWPGITPIDGAVDLTGKKITIVPLSATVSVLNGMAQSAAAALRHMGAQVSVCDGKAAPTQVASCLQTAQSQHDYAVVTEFVSYGMVPNALASLSNAGTHVLVVGDSPEKGTTYPKNVAFQEQSQSLITMSKLEADAAIADYGTKANILVEELTDTANQLAQGQAVVDELKAKCPSCTATVTKFTTANATQLPSQISSQLVSHPTINAVVLPVDAWMPQSIQGVTSAGKSVGTGTGHIELISTGSDVDGLQRVATGQEAHDFGAPVQFDGYTIANAVELQAAGKPVPNQSTVTRDFVKSNVSGLQMNATGYNGSSWFGNSSFIPQFYKAWGGK